jgi:hypothetical protein
MTAGWLIGPRLGIPGRVRLAFAGVALVCLAILTVARMLPPNQRGMGTHEALGLPPCGFVLTSGLPCPTCGMTTAFALLLHGRPVDAFVAQPAGAVLCVATLALFILSVQTVWTGRMIQVNWDRIGHVRLLVGFGLLVLGGWGFKLAHGLLTGAFPAH